VGLVELAGCTPGCRQHWRRSSAKWWRCSGARSWQHVSRSSTSRKRLRSCLKRSRRLRFHLMKRTSSAHLRVQGE
jgi:hypothetical protein